MAVFEISEGHQMYLGIGNQVNKGERLTLIINKMGVQPNNILSDPESRREAIQFVRRCKNQINNQIYGNF